LLESRKQGFGEKAVGLQGESCWILGRKILDSREKTIPESIGSLRGKSCWIPGEMLLDSRVKAFGFYGERSWIPGRKTLQESREEALGRKLLDSKEKGVAICERSQVRIPV
jgi:hypothetical protein